MGFDGRNIPVLDGSKEKGVLENWGNNKLNKITIIIANKEAFISIF